MQNSTNDLLQDYLCSSVTGVLPLDRGYCTNRTNSDRIQPKNQFQISINTNRDSHSEQNLPRYWTQLYWGLEGCKDKHTNLCNGTPDNTKDMYI